MGKKLSKGKKTDNYEVAQNQVDDDDDEEEATSGAHMKKNKEKTSLNLDKLMDERLQERKNEEARQSTSQDAPRAKIHKQPNVPEPEDEEGS